MKNFPASINMHIFRFFSHPVADAIRKRISEFQAISSQYGSSDLHTFYILFFLHALPKILDDMYDRMGFSMGIDSNYFRPSLWQLCKSEFPGYVFAHYFVDKNRARFRSNQTFLEHIIVYRINVKD